MRSDNPNNLYFQFHAAIQEGVSGEELGLGVGSKLLQSLRQQVVMLAISKGVLSTVKDAAKGTLSSGWSLLLPTTEERAKTLSELLAEKQGKLKLLFDKSFHESLF